MRSMPKSPDGLRAFQAGDGATKTTKGEPKVAFDSFAEFWASNEEDAIAIGLTIDQWWQLTPREGRLYFSAYRKRLEREFKARDTANFILGKYIGIAVNAPKKYPHEPMSAGEFNEPEENQTLMDETDEAKINALFGAFSAKADKLPSATEKSQEAPSTQATEQK